MFSTVKIDSETTLVQTTKSPFGDRGESRRGKKICRAFLVGVQAPRPHHLRIDIMPYSHYYIPFEPHPPNLDDAPSRKAAFKIPITTDDTEEDFEIALFCNDLGMPEFLRIKVTKLKEKELPPHVFPHIQALSEHMISILRLTCDINLAFADFGRYWQFFDDDEPYNFGMQMTLKEGKKNYDPVNSKNLFIAAFDTRYVLRLYADGIDNKIPIQYRFLSFFMVLESLYKDGHIWKKTELEELINSFSQRFIDAALTTNPVELIHTYRDRCAHVRTGRGKRMIRGVTHLNHKEADTVAKLLPIMRKICAVAINKISTDKYQLTTDVKEGWEPTKSD